MNTHRVKAKKSKADLRPVYAISFCAHNDDHTIAAGGTLAKYAKEGKRFATYIFSYGEKSHPWLKPIETAHMRYKESLISEKVLGGKDMYYLGIPEGKFKDDKNAGIIKEKIKEVVRQDKPEKIFTHSIDDPHPDHRAVFGLVIESLKEIHYAGDVYSFEVWNPVNLVKRQNPKMVVDISDTFPIKVKSFYKHKSQKTTMVGLWWKIYLHNFLSGLSNQCEYAEVFYKVDVS